MTVALAGTSQVALSATLTLSDSAVVVADGTNPPTTTNTGVPQIPNPTAPPAFLPSGASFSFVARERQNPGQTNIRVATFLEFDTSTLTLADVIAPSFSAMFTIEHVGHLNNLNTGMDLSIGRNVSGTWDSTSSLPSFGWAAASADQAVLLANVHTAGSAQALALDITPIVKGWVDGSFANEGLVLLGTRGATNGGNNSLSQASFLDNATINTVPEPSSLLLAGLGLLGLAGRRRR